MCNTQLQDVSKAVLTSMTEAELANWYRQRGEQVIYHRDRYWRETPIGFYQPLHWMARLSEREATCPGRLHWGFRASLCDDDAESANGSLPVHLLSNVKDYDFNNLGSKCRNNLRKCRKLVKIVQLTEPEILQQQGYETLCSALTRTAHTKIPSKAKYLKNIADYFSPGCLVLAGLIGNKLGGYLTGCAINETAYLNDRIVATEALTTDISSGLTFEFVQACRQSGQIREVVSGIHTPQNPGLCEFKEKMGFPVKHIPCKVNINPLVEQFIHWRYPLQYYYLTGRV